MNFKQLQCDQSSQAKVGGADPRKNSLENGEGCLLPAAQKSDRRTFSTISGNSWGLPIHLLRGFGIFSNDFFSGISSSIQGRTRQQALYMGDFLSASRETSGSMGACSNWCPASPFDLGSSLLTKEVVIGWSGGSYRNPHPSKPTLGEP